jgi:RNA polymerase sigma-70 factor (ECF subfamily)
MFAKLWANRDQLMIQDSIKGYLFQAAKNMMVDHIRANKKHKKNEPLEVLKIENINFDIKKDLDPQLIRQAILTASKKLKSKTQTIFMLWSFEGLTYEEISAHLNISKRIVDYNISVAFAFLREELKNSEIIFDE